MVGQLNKIPAELVETLAGFLQEILNGQFQGFSRDSDSLPNSQERDAVLIAMGVKSKLAQQIADFAGSIETELQQISDAIDAIAGRNSISEPSIEARKDLRAAIEIGVFLHRNSKTLIGGKALTAFNRIAENPNISLQSIMLLVWAEYRGISKTILPFSEIIELQRLASQLTEKYQI